MRTLFRHTLFILLAAILLSACSQKPTPTEKPAATSVPTSQAGLANPASVNCEEKGGKLEFRERGELGQYGVCMFEDNRQCEEWALLRGECPCRWCESDRLHHRCGCLLRHHRRGIRRNRQQDGAADEQGTCTFKNGTICDVWEYFGGKCYPVK